IKRYGLIEKTKEYNISNADKGYLPQVSLSAKASYQSDVTEIPVDLPGIDIRGMRKDQYQAMLQLDQVVWDGGNIRARKEVTRATSEVDKQKLEVDMYAINERVNQLFFGILLLKEQLKQNQLMQEELQRNYDNVTAYVKNGIANQADLDAVKVEQLNNIQQRHTLEATYRAYSEMLKIMINHPTPLTGNTLKKPDVNALLYKGEAYSAEFIRRPELNLFAAQNQQLEAQRKQLTAKNLPRLGIFVQGAYGNPGLNMLKNEFSAYYVAGVRLSWNFSNLYTRKNESRQLILNQQDVNVQKETFLFNTHLEITQNNSEIKKLTELMKNDEEIITLRNNIKKSAQAKVANGTLTVTEMLREVTAENIARQDKILHEIQLLSAIYELKYTTNQYENK
ncbi:TolC family protein, partial [Phocaeicola dorei]